MSQLKGVSKLEKPSVMGDGARCLSCGETALSCQNTFLASPEDGREWCCDKCGEEGPSKLHRTMSNPNEDPNVYTNNRGDKVVVLGTYMCPLCLGEGEDNCDPCGGTGEVDICEPLTK